MKKKVVSYNKLFSKMTEDKIFRTVFVGNIPQDVSEERLKEIFCDIGPVTSFLLQYDKDTNKRKDYAFCEYRDHETALSAARNLNNYEICGRTLSVRNVSSEKSRAEWQANFDNKKDVSKNRKESPSDNMDNNETITKAVASLPPEQMFELMKQMKLCIENNGEEAKQMLLRNPQLAYALLQAQVVMRIVDPPKAFSMLQQAKKGPATTTANSNATVQPASDSGTTSNKNAGTTGTKNTGGAANNKSMGTASNKNAGGTANNKNSSAANSNKNQTTNVKSTVTTTATATTTTTTTARNNNIPVISARATTSKQLSSSSSSSSVFSKDVDMRTVLPSSKPVDEDLRVFYPPIANQIYPGFGMPSGNAYNMGPQVSQTITRPPVMPTMTMVPSAGPPLNIANTFTNSRPQIASSLPTSTPSTSSTASKQATTSKAIPDTEKAALLMQVMQVTDEQLAMLPVEHRQHILALKQQISNTATTDGR